MELATDFGIPPPRVFGRRSGRQLRPGRRATVALRLPERALPPLPEGARLDPGGLFEVPVADVWLEIGFGSAST
ncbi:MAG: hypothetical protein U1E38_02060 [Rhodospirillales bacterium]